MTKTTWISSTMRRGRTVVRWATRSMASFSSSSGHDGYADEHALSSSGRDCDESLRRTGRRDDDRHSAATLTDISLRTTQIEVRTGEMTVPETEILKRTWHFENILQLARWWYFIGKSDNPLLRVLAKTKSFWSWLRRSKKRVDRIGKNSKAAGNAKSNYDVTLNIRITWESLRIQLKRLNVMFDFRFLVLQWTQRTRTGW